MLSKEELLNVEGGKFTASFLNGVVRGINSFMDLGRSIGTAIRRISARKVCPL